MTSISSDHILSQILTVKRQEVEGKRKQMSLEMVRIKAQAIEKPCRHFKTALETRILAKKPAVIAELKKASPSKGVIRQDFDIFALARAYERGHATCLSVLTDQTFFQGHDSFLSQVRETVDLPLLRKDFIINEYQVYESRMLGADAILLIAAVLKPEQIRDYAHVAEELGMGVMIEVHSLEEYNAVSSLTGHAMIGINNRDLKDFSVDLNTTLTINEALKPGQWCITESGISNRADVEFMLKHDIYGFLVGEALMKFEDPYDGLSVLFPELELEHDATFNVESLM